MATYLLQDIIFVKIGVAALKHVWRNITSQNHGINVAVKMDMCIKRHKTPSAMTPHSLISVSLKVSFAVSFQIGIECVNSSFYYCVMTLYWYVICTRYACLCVLRLDTFTNH